MSSCLVGVQFLKIDLALGRTKKLFQNNHFILCKMTRVYQFTSNTIQTRFNRIILCFLYTKDAKYNIHQNSETIN